jgi:hypothetical protein
MTTDVTRWEYATLHVKSFEELKKAGQRGWEMTGIYDYYIYLKRPVSDKESTPPKIDYCCSWEIE